MLCYYCSYWDFTICCYHIGIVHWKLTVMFVTFYQSQLIADTIFRCCSAVCHLFVCLQWYGLCLWSSTLCKDSSYSWLSLAPGRFGAACACSLDCSMTLRHNGQSRWWTQALLTPGHDRQWQWCFPVWCLHCQTSRGVSQRDWESCSCVTMVIPL
jgi:hypothetical protein